MTIAESTTTHGPPETNHELGMQSTMPLPPLMLVYTCRHASELQVLLPLLKYTHSISIHIFYTGTEALESRMLHTPGPITSHALDDLPNQRSPSDSELGFTSQAKSVAMFRGFVLPKMIEGRGLNFVVFFLTFFAFYWANVRTPAAVFW
jgi:hypothetical protein